jgi:hypothetical protein
LSNEIKENEINRGHLPRMQKRNAYLKKRGLGIDDGIKLKRTLHI